MITLNSEGCVLFCISCGWAAVSLQTEKKRQIQSPDARLACSFLRSGEILKLCSGCGKAVSWLLPNCLEAVGRQKQSFHLQGLKCSIFNNWTFHTEAHQPEDKRKERGNFTSSAVWMCSIIFPKVIWKSHLLVFDISSLSLSVALSHCVCFNISHLVRPIFFNKCYEDQSVVVAKR